MSEALWALVGAAVGGCIAIAQMVVRERYAAARQKESLEAERIGRREAFWCETIAGPSLNRQRDNLERLLELLSRREMSTGLSDDLRALAANVPPEVQSAVFAWMSAMRDAAAQALAPGAERATETQEIKCVRYMAVAACVRCLRDAMSPEAARRFVARLDTPWMGWREEPDQAATDAGSDAPPQRP